jgi:hypothetical protein
MIRMGWSPLWEKYGRADARWRPELDQAEQEAKAEGAGAWTTAPDYMRDKANEITAPTRKQQHDAAMRPSGLGTRSGAQLYVQIVGSRTCDQ